MQIATLFWVSMRNQPNSPRSELFKDTCICIFCWLLHIELAQPIEKFSHEQQGQEMPHLHRGTQMIALISAK